jgi:hypothetical protein
MIYVGAIAVAYALASLLWAPETQPWALAELASLVVAFAVGRIMTGHEYIWGTLIWSTAIAICIYVAFPIINPDYIACVIALASIAAIAFDVWWMLPIFAFGLWFTANRGAIIAAGVGAGYFLFKRFPATAICGGLLAVLAAIIIKHGGGSFFQRVGIWQDTLNHLTIWGHGFGSFATTYATWSPHTNVTFYLPSHAYNDSLELISDLGLGAIPLWLFIAICLGSDRRHRAIFLTFIALGFTYYPLWIPPCAQLAFFALGQLSKGATYGTLETNAAPLSQYSTAAGWYRRRVG